MINTKEKKLKQLQSNLDSGYGKFGTNNFAKKWNERYPWLYVKVPIDLKSVHYNCVYVECYQKFQQLISQYGGENNIPKTISLPSRFHKIGNIVQDGKRIQHGYLTAHEKSGFHCGGQTIAVSFFCYLFFFFHVLQQHILL